MQFHILSPAQQVEEHLKSEILRGRWQQEMPGVVKLEAELGVNRTTIEAGLRLLEKQGILLAQGVGKKRLIMVPESGRNPKIRVKILHYDWDSRKVDYHIDLRYRLGEAGHDVAFADKTLQALRMDVGKVARFVRDNPADAWVVASASREILEWFTTQPVPAFALFGRMVGLPIASTGPRKSPAVIEAVRRLVELGHRRIVMMVREERRKPTPGFLERVFLDALQDQGIPVGSFNLPNWGDDMTAFHKGLDSLFQISPPTALLFPNAGLFSAAQQHLALRGIVAPRDVSLICLDPDPLFVWHDPPVSHIHYDSAPWVRRIVRWVNHVSKGIDDRRSTPTPARFIEGGTIGPAAKGL